MMRKILIGVFIAFAFNAFSQLLPIDAKTEKVTFQDVIATPGVSPALMYKKAKEWGKEQSGSWTINQDVANSKLIFDVKRPISYPAVRSGQEKGTVSSTFTIGIKDGKIRYIVTNFVHSTAITKHIGGKLEAKDPACGIPYLSRAGWNAVKNKTKAAVDKEVASLKQLIKELSNDPVNDAVWSAVSMSTTKLPIYDKTGRITFMNVMMADGIATSTLFLEVKKWGEGNAGWKVTKEESDKKLVFNVKEKIYYPAFRSGQEQGYMSYTFTILFRNGKTRYIVRDFMHTSSIKGHNGGKLEDNEPDCGLTKVSRAGWTKVKLNTSKKVNAHITKLDKRIKEVVNDPNNNDDW